LQIPLGKKKSLHLSASAICILLRHSLDNKIHYGKEGFLKLLLSVQDLFASRSIKVALNI
jgi:hypothetical protein